MDEGRSLDLPIRDQVALRGDRVKWLAIIVPRSCTDHINGSSRAQFYTIRQPYAPINTIHFSPPPPRILQYIVDPYIWRLDLRFRGNDYQ